MKDLIIGHGRHGKDTFAEMIGGSFQSSSEAALDIFLFDILNDYREDINIPLYKTRDEAFIDRVNWRAMWHEEISRYNTPDKSKLAKGILSAADCYVGMRCNKEYKSCIDQGLFDRVFWVDASERKPKEDKSSFNIDFDPETMIFIDNNSSENDLNRVAKIYSMEIKGDLK